MNSASVYWEEFARFRVDQLFYSGQIHQDVKRKGGSLIHDEGVSGLARSAQPIARRQPGSRTWIWFENFTG